MSLHDEAVQRSRTRKPGPRCGVVLTIERVPEKRRREVAALIADLSIYTTVATEIINEKVLRPAKQHDMPFHAIAGHRNRKCRCLDPWL